VLLALFLASQAVERTTMIDLSLFRRPAFVGAQTTAFAISSSLFAMFLYLTLYLQNVLGYSPLQTGIRFLPISAVSFFAAPAAGRLSARLPVRLLLGVGLGLCALSMWLMSRITVDSSWTALLAGFLIGGVGIGFVNAPLASTAVSTVRRERAGMASGLNNTFRQLGIATGIAALGAIFQDRISSKVESGLRGVPDAHRVAQQMTSGQAQKALVGVPPHLRAHVAAVAKASFVSGLSEILVVGALVAACGAVLAFALVRRQDFVASAPAPEAG
jgi:predicted MFS family arabinose efflux permease